MPEAKDSKRLSKALVSLSAPIEQKRLLPTKATSEEVRKFFKDYVKEVNASVELSQTSKTMYIDFASCFVRWMHGGFQPGNRGHNARTLRKLRGRVL